MQIDKLLKSQQLEERQFDKIEGLDEEIKYDKICFIVHCSQKNSNWSRVWVQHTNKSGGGLCFEIPNKRIFVGGDRHKRSHSEE